MSEGSTSRRDFLKLVGVALVSLGVGGAVGYYAGTSVKVFPEVTPAKKRTPYGGTLKVAIISEPGNLHSMMQGADIAMGEVMTYNIYQGLVDIDEYGNIIPLLAERWWQPSLTSWRFKLREGVQFHHGYGEMTAEDVAFCINTIVKEKKFIKYLFWFVKEAEVVDKYVVQVNLEKPFSPFLSITAREGILVASRKAYEEKGDEKFGREPVGTGAFELEEWKAGDHITLRRHKKYWKPGRPYLDKVVFKFVPDKYVKETMLKTGEVDLIDTPMPKDIDSLLEEENITIAKSTGWNWDYISFRNAPDHPWSGWEEGMKVRQAISYAIDRAEICKEIYYGYATPTDIPLPEGFLGWFPEPRYFPMKADIPKAKELLREAGYEGGFDIKIITSDKTNLREELELVQSQLKKVKINVIIENLDMGTYIGRWTRTRDFEANLEDITIMGPDSDAAIYWFHRSETVGNQGYESPKVDELIDKQRSSPDPEERKRLIRQILDIVIPSAHYIYICHVQLVNMMRKNVLNYITRHQEYKMYFEDVILVE